MHDVGVAGGAEGPGQPAQLRRGAASTPGPVQDRAVRRQVRPQPAAADPGVVHPLRIAVRSARRRLQPGHVGRQPLGSRPADGPFLHVPGLPPRPRWSGPPAAMQPDPHARAYPRSFITTTTQENDVMRSIQLTIGSLAVVATSGLIGLAVAPPRRPRRRRPPTTEKDHRSSSARHVLKCAGTSTRRVYASLTRTDRYGNVIQVVIGDVGRRRLARGRGRLQGRPARCAAAHGLDGKQGRHRGHRHAASARGSPSTRSTTTPASTSRSTAPTAGWRTTCELTWKGRTVPLDCDGRRSSTTCRSPRGRPRSTDRGSSAAAATAHAHPGCPPGSGRPGRTASACR